jgi:protoporphyrin/coproporphyrin ferrochelatase
MAFDPAQKTAILALNFGEPEHPTLDEVVPFLERIFYANASLEPSATEADRRARSRELAERRAPGLVEEYEAIGGSPLNAQARAEAEALERILADRGYPVPVYVAYQYADPLVADVVREARAAGVERLVGLTVYPLCGHSTNVAALNDVAAAIRATEGEGYPPLHFEGLTGWHRHPDYLSLRADAIRRVVAEAGVDLSDPRTKLVFSAHGTPIKYLEAGSGYARYVDEFCREVAGLLGLADEAWVVGFQNHTNRRIAWTEPDVEEVIQTVDADTVVVDPVSFMHEQSETLAELDHELRGEAEARGLGFHRVPVPHDDPRYPELLADLMEPFLTGQAARSAAQARSGGEAEAGQSAAGLPGAGNPAGLRFGPCRCRPEAGTYCLNALPREVAAPAPADEASTEARARARASRPGIPTRDS